ncbi:EAL domain-containing protein [Ammoniphilus sp. 3BR4]|uniref:EAL domain-containing protein n=1 Tax=Ammoniphilus sp. 3BR4 TaxID=3158265 RepID=UPI0034660213
MLHQVMPYFQPIFSLDNQMIWGYEVLGRIRSSAGTCSSLGAFFSDMSVEESVRKEVDKTVRKMALAKFCEQTMDVHLFINIDPNWITDDLNWLLDDHVIPENIVLEINERDFEGNVDELSQILAPFRELGCKIAVDDLGKGFSNLDRVACLKPDFIKVDLHLVQKSTQSRSYRSVLSALSLLSQKLGSALIYEGIEEPDQFANAWRNGGQFYQGYLLAKPHAEFLTKEHCQTLLQQQMDSLVKQEFSFWNDHFNYELKLNQKMGQCLQEIAPLPNLDEYTQQFTRVVGEPFLRLYLCDSQGNQYSSNYVKDEDGSWAKKMEYKGMNWNFRPYFMQNIVKMNNYGRGILSESYIDREFDLMIQTFSCPVYHDLFLFLDIPAHNLH